ncbi:MAG: RES family NAD+ phosphorylase [Gemmatimonadaceae bacterium]
MSSNIWMQCAGVSERRALRVIAWRVVEAQHQLSTRKLVDSAAEQELLEELIESVKPRNVASDKLHFLLFTPFRYPPLCHGSRFGTRQERGIWYGSELQRTAFAEVSYYRLLFLAGTHAEFDALSTTLTAFTTMMQSSHAIDLASAPFDAYLDRISSPISYGDSQALGTAMRDDGIELLRYRSARDTHGACNVAAFSPLVFHRAKPRNFETWHCTATRNLVEFLRPSFVGKRERLAFTRSQFEVDGVLPSPAV